MNTSIPTLKKFKVGNDELDIDALLKRDYEDVREASQVLPAAMSYLGWQRGYYREQLFNAEVSVKEVKARLTLKYKIEGLESDGYMGVKPTEGAIEAAVLVHPDTIAAQNLVGKFVRVVDNLFAQIDAFKHKIELVRSGEATTRQAAAHEPLSDEELENRLHNQQTGE